MYSEYFGMEDNAFSITPDPRYLYMSERHCEAIAHLLYGVVESGCFVALTGEVGTGKTTICRAVLEQLPDNVEVALLLDPPRSEHQLLLALLDELKVAIPRRNLTSHELVNCLYEHLLHQHATGKRTVVIIDEAQNIQPEVLERVRLLTNLETHTEKLLHVILIGQSELRQLLAKHSLRQVAQRITARYHLAPLTRLETECYIAHRLSVAGAPSGLFSSSAMRQIYQDSDGIPRVINLLCDRALLTAYANELPRVGKAQVIMAVKAWRDHLDIPHKTKAWESSIRWLGAIFCGLLLLAGIGSLGVTAAAARAEHSVFEMAFSSGSTGYVKQIYAYLLPSEMSNQD